MNDPVALDAVAGLPMHAVAEAGQNMQVHGQIEILRRGPETLVMFRCKRQARMWHLPDHGADPPAFLAALHLGDGMIDVEHGDQRDTVEPIGHLLAVVDHPVVVGAKERFLQRRIVDAV